MNRIAQPDFESRLFECALGCLHLRELAALRRAVEAARLIRQDAALERIAAVVRSTKGGVQ